MGHGRSATRILIVDDDELSRELLTVLLEGEGYAVRSADSGAAALMVLEAEISPPEVVLSDMQMPGLSGAALAERMRAICGEATKLLAMSGSQPQAEALRPYDGFLLKPFTMDELAGKIQSVTLNVPLPSEPLAPQPVTGEDGSAPLDAKTFEELAEMMRPKQMAELYGMALRDAEMHVGAMHAALAAGDEDDFRRRAHAMKGSFGMVGARDLQGVAAEMEARGPGATNDSATLEKFKLAMGTLRRILMARGLPLDGA